MSENHKTADGQNDMTVMMAAAEIMERRGYPALAHNLRWFANNVCLDSDSLDLGGSDPHG